MNAKYIHLGHVYAAATGPARKVTRIVGRVVHYRVVTGIRHQMMSLSAFARWAVRDVTVTPVTAMVR